MPPLWDQDQRKGRRGRIGGGYGEGIDSVRHEDR